MQSKAGQLLTASRGNCDLKSATGFGSHEIFACQSKHTCWKWHAQRASRNTRLSGKRAVALRARRAAFLAHPACMRIVITDLVTDPGLLGIRSTALTSGPQHIMSTASSRLRADLIRKGKAALKEVLSFQLPNVV